MALPESSLSHVCKGIADFISKGLQASAHSIRILVGTPADAAPAQTETQHRINLFFYRFEPMEFQADGSPGDIWWFRLHCLITPFAIAEDQISSGENDLRLIGELLRLFHENPVIDIPSGTGDHCLLQIIFQPLGADVLNHIWSTQHEVSYRPSVAYELAVSPVIPKKPATGSPLTGRIGYQVRAGGEDTSHSSPGVILTPHVSTSTVDTSVDNWAPVICFIHDGTCAISLAFEKGSLEWANFQPEVWIAGEPPSPVRLIWEVWNSEAGWQPEEQSIQATIATRRLDPKAIGSAQTVILNLPSDNTISQAVLYAEREYRRTTDNHAVLIRSNPLLVTLYEAT